MAARTRRDAAGSRVRQIRARLTAGGVPRGGRWRSSSARSVILAVLRDTLIENLDDAAVAAGRDVARLLVEASTLTTLPVHGDEDAFVQVIAPGRRGRGGQLRTSRRSGRSPTAPPEDERPEVRTRRSRCPTRRTTFRIVALARPRAEHAVRRRSTSWPTSTG